MREGFSENLISTENEPLEGFYVELNLRNSTWLLNCSYNPHKNIIEKHLIGLSEYLDLYSSIYEKKLNTRRLECQC